MNDRFSAPQVFKTGVRWQPTDYKPMDQTPYLAYAEKHAEKVRKLQEELR